MALCGMTPAAFHNSESGGSPTTNISPLLQESTIRAVVLQPSDSSTEPRVFNANLPKQKVMIMGIHNCLALI